MGLEPSLSSKAEEVNADLQVNFDIFFIFRPEFLIFYAFEFSPVIILSFLASERQCECFLPLNTSA